MAAIGQSIQMPPWQNLAETRATAISSANYRIVLSSWENCIEWKCPDVSKETIRSVLKAHPDCFTCEGRGVAAQWLKLCNIPESKA